MGWDEIKKNCPTLISVLDNEDLLHCLWKILRPFFKGKAGRGATNQPDDILSKLQVQGQD